MSRGLSFVKDRMGNRILTVRFVVFLHEYERVVLNVAEVFDIRPREHHRDQPKSVRRGGGGWL